MSTMKKLIVSLVLMTLIPLAYCEDKAFRIGFVIPRSTNDMFYAPVVEFMQAAAQDLGVELKIIETFDDHLKTREFIEQSYKKQKLDGLIVVSVKESGVAALKFCEEMNIPMLTEDAVILDPNVGEPRQKHKLYIGALSPDDEMGGYELAKFLISRAKPATTGKIQIVAVSGPFGTSSAIGREKGLQKAIKETPNAELMQTVSARWDPVLAKKMYLGLKDRFPENSVAWAASDGMALGIANAADDLKLRIGKDLQIGGVDWSQEGIAALKTDRIQATAGGHFMEAAWALIVMNDYLSGIDFAKSDGVRIKTNMTLLTQKNIATYSPLLDKKNWAKIDFKKLSKKYNKSLTQYDFSLSKVLKDIKN